MKWGFAVVALGLVSCSQKAHDPADASPVVSSSASAPAAPSAASAAPSSASASTSSTSPAPESPAAAKSQASASPVVFPPGDRIYAKARHVWIQRAPQSGQGWIGYLTLGGSVRLYEGDKEKARMIGPGCKEWFRVEPDGFVCLGAETTLDPNDPEFVAIQKHRGREGDPFPFEYGESLGTPRYEKPPNAKEQRKAEWDLEDHLAKISAAKAAPKDADPLYLGLDFTPAGESVPALPSFGGLVREARTKVIRGSTIAWSRSYDDEAGRTWLYTSDHAWVPKDRVKPYPRSDFAGLSLSGDGAPRLPIAFFRKKDGHTYRIEGGTAEITGEPMKRLSHVELSDERRLVGTVAFLKLRNADLWVREADCSVARLSQAIPYRKDEGLDTRRTWLDISIFGGTLVAYEDLRPVFVTLISPGRGGTPVPGRDPVSTASTPTGTFRVDGKFRWATMVSSSDANIVHAEVQYVQNFHGPHALHGAYWHDAFGELKSGGCVNLSPTDSKWVFEWTDPKLPTDWHGLRSTSDRGIPTRIIIRD